LRSKNLPWQGFLRKYVTDREADSLSTLIFYWHDDVCKQIKRFRSLVGLNKPEKKFSYIKAYFRGQEKVRPPKINQKQNTSEPLD
jgi:hypothetical protein